MPDNKNENRMDLIWAPWRMSYIHSDIKAEPEPVSESLFLPEAEKDCFLCQAAACEPSAFRDRLILARTELTVTLLNRYPYTNGHLLVVPRRHVSGLEMLTAEEKVELFDGLVEWTERLKALFHPDGFNVGLNLGRAAGAGVPGHLHWHIIPRWNGDTNFVTTVGSTKVIPQSMEELVDALKRY